MSKMPHVGYSAGGDRPTPNGGSYSVYAALMILNPSPSEADLELDLFWIDRPPMKSVALTVATDGVRRVRLDRPDEIGGVVIPGRTPYAMRLRANSAGVVQDGRLETATATYALVGGSGYHAGGGMRARPGCSTHSPGASSPPHRERRNGIALSNLAP